MALRHYNAIIRALLFNKKKKKKRVFYKLACTIAKSLHFKLQALGMCRSLLQAQIDRWVLLSHTCLLSVIYNS